MRWPRDADAPAVMALAWATVVLPRVVQSLDVEKRRATLNDPAPVSALAQLVELACSGALLLACAVVLARRLGHLPVTGRRALVLLLAPWVYTVLRSLYLGQLPLQPSQLLYPAVVVALWATAPRLPTLAVLGWLHAGTVGVSLALGVLLPSKGIYQSLEGAVVDPEKALLPIGILIGPFTDGNNLGQVLALGLPAVAFLPRRDLRWAVGLLTLAALTWTSSRSALVAVVTGGVLWLVLRRGSPLGRQLLAGAVLSAGLLAVAALPLATTDPQAFTNRGQIWATSLAAWNANPLFGLGVDWYATSALYGEGPGAFAFHGHNQFVHLLVTVGLVGLVLVALLALAVIVSATHWAARGVQAPAAFVVVLLVTCLQEVSYGVVDRGFLLAVGIVPLAVIALTDPSPAGEGASGSRRTDGVLLQREAAAGQQADDQGDRDVEPGPGRRRGARQGSGGDGHRADAG